MLLDPLTGSQIDYNLCRYGKSTLLFRGPRHNTDRDFVAFIGGTDTYGKGIERPFPQIVETEIGMPCVNLGCAGAGLNLMLEETALKELTRRAKATVFQIPGAQNVSNRFFTVKARRNARIDQIQDGLTTLFEDDGLRDVASVSELLKTLHSMSDSRFSVVTQELSEVWLRRMREMLRRIEGPTILLWFALRTPDDPENFNPALTEPLFVNRDMIEDLRPDVSDIVEVAPESVTLDQEAHEEVAFSLSPIVERLI